MWPRKVKEQALVSCGRRCSICHTFCGTKIELHHIVPESKGGLSTIENCIPLCFNCHADVEHYNPAHPKGTKFSSNELRGHRDKWFAAVSDLSRAIVPRDEESKMYEGQRVELGGYVWREAFPGPPNYESLETDTREVCWMLVLKEPITLIASSFEDESSYEIGGFAGCR
ncbi:HNH endonuclease [Thiosocius teredinicola]|uniref:HNH endonuclease n=1 Tax=Thiosocius teredinicola TaxID=1973002 RepID=UPI0009910333